MRKSIFVMALLLCSLSLSAAKKAPKQGMVTRIDPTDWYCGLKDASLQLMVYGQGIRDAEFSTDYAGVRVDSLVRLDSPNYLLVYLDMSGAQPGVMNLQFTLNGKKQTVKYTLKAREKRGEERMGFTNADVLYMLMPDRFANGDTKNDQIAGMNAYKCDRTQHSLRHGGDLEGLRQHLDYFNELGVTALWFTPVLENNSPDNPFGYSTYHGYATTDYYRVDPRFGTNAEYRRLTDEAHGKGLKVVMDMIFNHCGFEHPWTHDMPSADWLNLPDWLKQSNGTSDPRGTDFLQTSYKLTPVKDPYASEVDMRETVEGWFVPTMPDLNQKNPHVMKYLIQNSIWWIETVGIDGIRMDTYPYADAAGMAQWMKTLHTEYPNFNVVGETWVTEPGYTAAWQDDPRKADRSYLPTVMDFTFFDRLDKARWEETDGWWDGFNRIYNGLVYDYLYPNPSSVMAFIENHDTDRFLKNGCDTLALKQALGLLLTMNRTPQLYYGTEILMNGTKEKTDGDVRRDFPGGFPGDEANGFTAEGRTPAQQAMFTWLSRLLHWRLGTEVITRGKQTQFIPYQGVYVIARQYKGRTVMTILNGTSKPATFDVKRYAEIIGSHSEARDVITDRKIALKDDFKLSPRQTLIIEF